MELKSYTHGPASGSAPKQLVILLHGLGADGRDLLGLAPHFGRNLPDAVFVAPDAPYPCDMAPMGYQWFSLQDWTPASILRGVQKAAPILDAFITEQMEKNGVPAGKTALVGFSQGTMMSLYVGPRFPEKLAGILGYSGALVWEPDLDFTTLNKIPVHLIHGNADMAVPLAAYYQAKMVLEQAAFPLSGGITHGLMHNIDEAGLRDGGTFLQRVLNQA
jgi:phospholipase/carboxylesterase